jgi:protein-tyrosine phosphatase
MHDPRRILSFPSWYNARDLGGYPTSDGQTTRWGSVLRADDPGQLTPQGLEALAGLGVTTVVDLRWPQEITASPNPIARGLPQIRYHNISLLARTEDEWGTLCGEIPKERWVCCVLEHCRAELKEVLGTIADAAPGPLLFHCVAGKDRTGAIAALLLALADALPEAIAYDYAMSAENLREHYLVRYAELGRDEILEAVRCPPQGVHNMLAYVQEYGGIEGYLQDIGLTPGSVAHLRSRLRSPASRASQIRPGNGI